MRFIQCKLFITWLFAKCFCKPLIMMILTMMIMMMTMIIIIITWMSLYYIDQHSWLLTDAYLENSDADVPAALTLTLSVTSNILPAVMQSVNPDKQNSYWNNTSPNWMLHISFKSVLRIMVWHQDHITWLMILFILVVIYALRLSVIIYCK